MEYTLAIYLIGMNLLGLWVMYADKKRAVKKAWRIPEKHLFGVSLLGGSLGTWAGMYLFHHKTKHWYFVFGMPAVFFVQVALFISLFANK